MQKRFYIDEIDIHFGFTLMSCIPSFLNPNERFSLVDKMTFFLLLNFQHKYLKCVVFNIKALNYILFDIHKVYMFSYINVIILEKYGA